MSFRLGPAVTVEALTASVSPDLACMVAHHLDHAVEQCVIGMDHDVDTVAKTLRSGSVTSGGHLRSARRHEVEAGHFTVDPD